MEKNEIIIDKVDQFIQKAIDNQKQLIIVNNVKNFVFISYVVDSMDVELKRNPLYIAIESSVFTGEIELTEKKISFMDEDYLIITNKEESVKITIGII